MAKTPVLAQSELEQTLRTLTEWQVREGQIERTIKAKSFPAGIAFIAQVANYAEEANHHPDIDIRYTNLTFRLSTHDSGGITEKDIALARRIDALVQDA